MGGHGATCAVLAQWNAAVRRTFSNCTPRCRCRGPGVAVLELLGYDIEQHRESIKLIRSAISLIHRAGLRYQLWRYGTPMASPLVWRCVMTICMGLFLF